MLAVPCSTLPPSPRIHPRTALVVSADRNFGQRLADILISLRWRVSVADSGSQAWVEAEMSTPEAVLTDTWLPDLNIAEFLTDFRERFPLVDMISSTGTADEGAPRGPYRQELLYALRRSQDSDSGAWHGAPGHISEDGPGTAPDAPGKPAILAAPPVEAGREPAAMPLTSFGSSPNQVGVHAGKEAGNDGALEPLPELIGKAASMLEVSRRIRLVAPRMTPVLVEGPTGSGKELVAEALHRLSMRSRKPFVAINCAAIPEALLEAELFGHTRGAFTGAVQGRVGRIESAEGGTLFLDEIGEMPLALQSKLLRFVESGELQRVGDNDTLKVDVRIVAATHRPLADHTKSGAFRPDLYYRLAVFLIRTPSLLEHIQDLGALVQHFLRRMGRNAPVKRLDQGAMAKLAAHDWPGNVRELEHVLERAAILAGDETVLTAREIDFGTSVN
jgi:DNA-binding NtrC family response regulator